MAKVDAPNTTKAVTLYNSPFRHQLFSKPLSFIHSHRPLISIPHNLIYKLWGETIIKEV